MKHEDEQRNEQELSETQQATTEANATEEPLGETAENLEAEGEADESAEAEPEAVENIETEPEAVEVQDVDDLEQITQAPDDADVDETEARDEDVTEADVEAKDETVDAEDAGDDEIELEAAGAEDAETESESAGAEEPETTDEAEAEAHDGSDDEPQEDAEAQAADDVDHERPEGDEELEADETSTEAEAANDEDLEEVDASDEDDLLTPPELPSDEPIVYGLEDDADGKGAGKTAIPRKVIWLAVGGIAAAALCAGLAMSGGNQDAASNTSTQTVEVEVATDEEDPDKPLRLTESSVAELLSTLNFDRSDVALTGDLVMIKASGGHLVVVQVLDENTGVSPWALVDLTVERGAALANQLANRTYQGEDDNRPFEITKLTWNVIDLDNESYMAVSFPPGFTEDSGSTAALLRASEGYTISDGMYYALGGESVGYERSGGTAPTDVSGEPIVTSAYLSSYGNGMPEEESQ